MNKVMEGGRLMNKETGEYYPWYTHPTLEFLDKMDLSEKIVFEYGIGDSSLWWSARCKELYGVESNPEWVSLINGKIGSNAHIVANTNYIKYTDDWRVIDNKDPDLFINEIFKTKKTFDIIIIDGLDREECVEPAIACIRKGGMIIFDNWMQPSVHNQSEATQRRLLSFEHNIYKQPEHDDWKTAVFFIQ